MDNDSNISNIIINNKKPNGILGKNPKDIKFLLKENIINKSKTYGNNYNDTIFSNYLEDMDINDIYFLNIEKLVFNIIWNEEIKFKSLESIEIYYKNILTGKKFICKNEKNQGVILSEISDKENNKIERKKTLQENDIIKSDMDLNNNNTNQENSEKNKLILEQREKYEFLLDENDYINSFTIVYGRYYIIRTIKLKTKNGIKFSLPEFMERKSIKPDIYSAYDEINPDIQNNAIVNLFYGRGNIIHNIGCEIISEKYYRKIFRVKYFMIMKGFKKQYKNFTGLDENDLLQLIDKKNLRNIDKNNSDYIENKYDEGIKKFFKFFIKFFLKFFLIFLILNRYKTYW